MFKQVVSALLGVQSRENLESEIERSSWVRIVTIGVIMAATFIAALMGIINLLLISP